MLEAFLFAFLAIIVGLGLVFMGYAAFRILLPIIGFLAGLWLGLDLVSSFALSYPLLGISLGLILGLILGAIFAAIAYFVYAFAVVIFGLALGYALGAGFIMLLFNSTSPGIVAIVVGFITAIAMGVLFMRTDMPKLYIMGLTSFAGASALIAGVLVLFGQIPPSQLGLAFVEPYIIQSWFLLLVWAIIGAIGFVSQYQMVQMSQQIVPEMYSYEMTRKEYEKKAKQESK